MRKHNLKAKNIVLEDTIRPQRQRVVLDLVGIDDEYLMNIWKIKSYFCGGLKCSNMIFFVGNKLFLFPLQFPNKLNILKAIALLVLVIQ